MAVQIRRRSDLGPLVLAATTRTRPGSMPSRISPRWPRSTRSSSRCSSRLSRSECRCSRRKRPGWRPRKSSTGTHPKRSSRQCRSAARRRSTAARSRSATRPGGPRSPSIRSVAGCGFSSPGTVKAARAYFFRHSFSMGLPIISPAPTQMNVTLSPLFSAIAVSLSTS